MQKDIAQTVEILTGNDNTAAYKALCELQKESEQSDSVYPHMDKFTEMLSSDNSYIRTRGLTLLAYNAKWDRDNKLNKAIGRYLKHITDKKPIAARKCIQLLPIIARYKSELRSDILSALQSADISFYESSMQPLIHSDIQKAFESINKMCEKT